MKRLARATVGGLAAVAVAGAVVACGLGIRSPDLFELTRTGIGDKLVLVVNDGGTIKCNDRAPRPLAESLLLRARDLAQQLDPDARRRLDIPPASNSIGHYRIKLPAGTVSFPDTAASRHPELARAEQWALDAAKQGCGLRG